MKNVGFDMAGSRNIKIQVMVFILSSLFPAFLNASDKPGTIDIDPEKSEQENFMIGEICLGEVLNKALLEDGWEKKQTIQINMGEKISFENRPKIVASGLDVRVNHQIKIYFEGDQLSSWKQRFAPGTSKVKIFFKPGYWRAESLKPGEPCN